uniref:Uncharacterized protein n=1 Tax=Anguilla anguilla TaxID=7936 RepID=A0A0E9V4D6_ANGAN
MTWFKVIGSQVRDNGLGLTADVQRPL